MLAVVEEIFHTYPIVAIARVVTVGKEVHYAVAEMSVM
jgi:hypothetical protein